MAFSSNNYQQLGFGDRTLLLNSRERKLLDASWAGAFAQEVFPRIDEKLFAPLYSTESASPSSPVNVVIGAMILEELFDLNDETIVENLVCDTRFQYALHTTSEVNQPLSARTIRRFRKRLADYQKSTGENILHACFWKFHGDLDSLIGQYFPEKGADSLQIEHAILRRKGSTGFDPAMIADPRVFKINTLPAHSDHRVYASAEEMQRAERETERHTSDPERDFRFSLNGLWKFSYAINPASAVPGFEKLSFDCHDWEEIPVPAHMQMEGYDRPAYVNLQYPWDGREDVRPGQVPQRFNPVGSYVKYFTVPAVMQGRPLYISFQGVESGFALWLNGDFVGYSEDSFTPSEFELTPYLVEGENKLAVRVFKWTSGSWLEDQDFYRFSGIFRDVFLYTVPDVHVWDLKIRALPDETCTSAELVLETVLRRPVPGQEESTAEGKTVDSSGEPAAGEDGPADRGQYGFMEYRLERNGKNYAAGRVENGARNEIRERIQRPALWSAEDPQLYDLFLTLYDGSRNPVEFIHEKVGFRRIEMKNGLMCLNGKRIVFKGVNRHEFTCDTGRAGMSEAVMRQDLALMKKNNINAIRTCHYPDDSKLYRLCDEYGIYLIAENNMETHGTWSFYEAGLAPEEYILPNDHREWQPALVDRVNSCYQRDKNHPSILIWSCGNESWGGSVIYEMSRQFHLLDPDRLVHYEGIFHDRRYNATSDMESQMYPSAASIRTFLEKHPEKPFICCEYSHSMGNSNGGLFKYTELTETEPRYQGGFIWDFVDQSLRKKDRYGTEYQAYGGDCMERPTDYSFSGNGLVAGDRMPYPKLQEVKFLYQNISVRVARDQFLVINRNLFVNTDQFDCVVLLEKEGERLHEETVQTAVPALSEKAYLLPFALPGDPGEYAVTVSFRLKKDTIWARAGYEVAFGQGVFRIEKEGSPMETESASESGGKSTSESGGASSLSIIRGIYNIGIRGMDFDALFSFLNGSGLKSYRYGGQERILLPPRPNFWRAPTDNDKGSRMPARYGVWKLASDYISDTRPEGLAAETPEEIGSSVMLEIERENGEPGTAGRESGEPRTAGRESGKSGAAEVPVIRQRLFLPFDCVGYSGTERAGTISPDAEKTDIDRPDADESDVDRSDVVRSDVDRPDVERRTQDKVYLTYRFHADGTVDFILDYDADGSLPPMPEFGLLFTMDADYDQVAWYGNGPAETYCDRDKGAKLGIYKGSVREQMTRYLVPQECGNKTGVRWAKVTDRRGRGLLFSVPEGQTMNFSALPWTPDEIENAAHHTELPPVQHTVVRCSMMQMGVGGDDSWGARTLDEFLLPNKGHLHFEVSVKGIV